MGLLPVKHDFSDLQAKTLDGWVDALPGQVEEGAGELLVEQVLVCCQLLDYLEGAVAVSQGLVRAKEGIPQDDLLVVLVAEVPGVR